MIDPSFFNDFRRRGKKTLKISSLINAAIITIYNLFESIQQMFEGT